MSKRTESKKVAVFELEPDRFSIHTFELSKRSTMYEFQQVKGKLYQVQENSKGKRFIYEDRARPGTYHCTAYSEKGVRITLEHNRMENGTDTYYMRMIVNPRVLIEPGCSYLGILPPEESSIKRLKKAFKKLFSETVFDNDINSYYISRLDLCTNIHCGNNKLFRELVRVLRKLPTPPKYERKFFKHKDKLKKKAENKYNKHYIRLSCGTHELVIYDKTYQIREGNLVLAYEKLQEGVLRFEVHCEREYMRKIEKKAGDIDTLGLLWLMMEESEGRIVDHFSRCFSDTKFVQIEALKQKIKKSGYKKEGKEIMLELASQLQRTQSVDKALSKIKKQGYDTAGTLDRFAKLGISPIPLRKKFCAESLPGPVELLRSVSVGKVKVEYVKAKYK